MTYYNLSTIPILVMKRRVDDLNYLRPFFIGLLEGDGTIIPLTGKLVPLGTIIPLREKK